MSDVNDLVARLDGAVASAKDRIQRDQQRQLQLVLERQKLMKDYEQVQAKIVEGARPRLEAFAKQFGERASGTSMKSETRRSVNFEFRSPKAYMGLTISIAPDRDIKNAVVEFDLKVVPVLWKFNSHSEFSTPVVSPDYHGLAKWIDDRLVEFVELYVHIHEEEFLDKAEYVEDPIAKVKFPKFAAGATLDHGGQTYYFIDDTTKAQFAKQK